MMIHIIQWQNILYNSHQNKASNVSNEFIALGGEIGKQNVSNVMVAIDCVLLGIMRSELRKGLAGL